jgi:adenylyltransferase/sulfurtransferase
LPEADGSGRSQVPERYARQAVLGVIGPEGQRRLGEKAVLVVGCGALGSTQAELLGRAGIGKLTLVDRDLLELHNLHRQQLFDEQDVHDRLPKAEAAARRLRKINSAIAVEAVVADVTPANVRELLAAADLLLDGTDNFETRYLLNDAAVREGKPFVYGGVLGTHGTVMAIRPGNGPCLRCILPEPPEAGKLPTCESVGVLNTAVAVVAALQVTEAIKILLDAPHADYRLHGIDVWTGNLTSARVARNPDCACCGRREFPFLDAKRGSSSTVFCGRNAVQVTPERPARPDFAALSARLRPLGNVTVNGLVLEFTTGEQRLVLFPDGRVLVFGTTSPSDARTLVAKYIGS